MNDNPVNPAGPRANRCGVVDFGGAGDMSMTANDKPTLIWLRRLWCRLFGHDEVEVADIISCWRCDWSVPLMMGGYEPVDAGEADYE
jgi:hypothetical protein